jgi:hypothetical protein
LYDLGGVKADVHQMLKMNDVRLKVRNNLGEPFEHARIAQRVIGL